MTTAADGADVAAADAGAEDEDDDEDEEDDDVESDDEACRTNCFIPPTLTTVK